jgi:flagellar biosynthetic protein FlhB
MSGGGDKDDRTEAPTARRLQKAREEGQVPVSHEVVLLAGLAAMTLTLMMMGSGIGRNLVRSLVLLLSRPDQPVSEPFALFHELAVTYLSAVAPFAAAITAGSVAATLGQTRLAMRTSAFTPDFGRLSPKKGLSRMFGVESLVETAKSMAKLAVTGTAVFQVLRAELPRLEGLPAAQLSVLPGMLMAVVIKLFIAILLAQLAIAAVDMFWILRRHTQQLRMSKTDIKDESKESEGDPAIKMRIRRIRMRRARQRMLAAVPTATVVVTNPTHYAVALTYDSAQSNVPKLVAKGVDTMATRIRDSAREHGVPIVENPPLARTLHQLPLNARIPPELYKAVAELIAYVWRLRGRQRS